MFWDDLLRRLRRDNPHLGPQLLAGAAGRVAVTPSRRAPRRLTYLALAVAIVVLLMLAFATGRFEVTAARDPGFPPAAAVRSE